MSVSPLVTIIVPVYNKAEWIIQTLESVAAQTYDSWECLVIDDGSTDESLRLINEFVASANGEWKVITQRNAGQAKARNLGITMARGEYVAFLDGDDVWLRHKLSEQVDYLNRHIGVDAVVSGFIIFEADQESKFRKVIHKDAKRMIYGWLKMKGFGGLIESTGIVKRKTLEAHGGFDEKLSTSGGLDLSLRLLLEHKLETIPHAHVMYRLSKDQWHKNEAELRKDLVTLVDQYADQLGGLSRISEWHDSYFYWNRMSVEGYSKIIWALVSSIIKFRFVVVAMFYSLISRNVMARIRGLGTENHFQSPSQEL